ncbi:unnamed protein product, partial [Cercopithifilaria johnstoni]
MPHGRMKCSVLSDKGGTNVMDKKSRHSRLITQEQIVGRKFVRKPK